MVSQPLQVTPLFAVPFGSKRHPDSARLNRELEALFLARETDEFRNPTPSHTAPPETFESRFNLFRWSEPCVQALRQFILDGVLEMVRQSTGKTLEDLSRHQFQNHTWFHITRYAGSFANHNHPLASWSAVYCVRAGDAVPDHPDSGLLRFFDPRVAAGGFTDPALDSLHRTYAFGSLDLRLSEGQLVVFPSYVYHEVTPYYGSETRITVASNCWFS